MFSNTKIKWTIDPQCSEVAFRLSYLLLEEENDTDGSDTPNSMRLVVKEIPVSIDYNLIIFEDKCPKQFWKRTTFSGLLVFANTGKNRLIILQHSTYTFDNCGRAAACYSVKGKLNKGDFDLDTDEALINNGIMLNSRLLFEGSVRLIQEG